MKTCKQCKQTIKSEVKHCPYCGNKNSSIGVGVGLLILFSVFFLFSLFVKTPEPTPTEKEEEKKLLHDVVIVRALKNSLNNPKSFELVEARRLSDKTLCITFRATNSFNAIITKEIAVDEAGNFLDAERICLPNTGENITSQISWNL